MLQKKYGKTPGRERKASNPNSNSNIKQLNNQNKLGKTNGIPGGKLNSLQFPLNPLPFGKINNLSSNNVTPSPSIWSKSSASFSDVVAHSPVEPKAVKKPLYGHSFGIMGNQDVRRNLSHEMDLKKLQNFDDLGLCGNSLGPIGTKKSPTQTPIWDPLPNPNLQRPTPIAPPLSPPDSFFSAAFPPQLYNNTTGNATSNLARNFNAASVNEQLVHEAYFRNLLQKQFNEQAYLAMNGYSSSTGIAPTSSNSPWSPAYQPNNNTSNNYLANQMPSNSFLFNGALRPPPGKFSINL